MSDEVKSACSAANLAAAILNENPNIIKAKFGLPLNGKQCLNCGNLIPYNHFYFCNRHCQSAYTKEHSWVMVSCSECGHLFPREIYKLKHSIGKDNQQYTFCNHRCQGKWAAKHYGFGVHRKFIGHGPIKYDWNQIWMWHKLTGYSGTRLSPHLGIQATAIDQILYKMRKALDKPRVV